MSEHFEGHDGRECGEHRTVGYRSWCFDCSEWCYPSSPCVRCEVPALKAAVSEMLTAQGKMLDRRAEADEAVRRELWQALHESADRVRDVLHGTESPSAAPSPVSAATEASGEAGEAQEG